MELGIGYLGTGWLLRVERHLCSAGEIVSDHFLFGPGLRPNVALLVQLLRSHLHARLRSDTGLSVTKWPWACANSNSPRMSLNFVHLMEDIAYSLEQEQVDSQEELSHLQLRPPMLGMCRKSRKRVDVACGDNKLHSPALQLAGFWQTSRYGAFGLTAARSNGVS